MQNTNSVNQCRVLQKGRGSITTTSPLRPVSPRSCAPQPYLPVSEKYTNRSFNRQASPENRIQSPTSSCKGGSLSKEERPLSHTGQWPRGRVEPSPQTSRAHQSIERRGFKGRSLEAEYLPVKQRPSLQRPKTSETPRSKFNEGTVYLPPEKKDFSLTTLKDVLSRAVIEKGKIDKNNIDNIIEDIKRRFAGEETTNDPDINSNIDVDVNQRVSLENSESDHIPVSKSRRLVGVVRKDELLSVRSSIKGVTSGYSRVYPHSESTILTKEASKRLIEDKEEAVEYIDLPGRDYSDFNKLVEKEENKPKLARQKKEEPQPSLEVDGSNNGAIVGIQNKRIGEEFSVTGCESNLFPDSVVEVAVGDGNEKDKRPKFESWKATEDPQMKSYIQSLIQDERNRAVDKSLQMMKDELYKRQALCKTICICKVCTSNRTSEKSLDEKAIVFDGNKLKPSEVKVENNTGGKHINRPRPQKLVRKETAQDSKVMVLKRNKNFQPESRVNIVPKSKLDKGEVPRVTQTAVDDFATEDAAEDLYIQCRIKRAASKRT